MLNIVLAAIGWWLPISLGAMVVFFVIADINSRDDDYL